MKKELKTHVQKAVTAIRKARRVLIASHINPDGDTIGCQLALGLALLHLGKKVALLNQDGIPTRYQFLPGSELILSQAPVEKIDVAVAVDCGSRRQLGAIETFFFKAKTTVQIDHHDFGEAFGDILVIEEDAAAVGEIVYEVIKALGVDITQTIATCLLTSIIVDTGSFRFSNIRPRTFDICRDLLTTGVNLQNLIEESYWKKSRSIARISGHCLMNTQFSENGTIAWATVYQRDFKRFRAGLADADAVADDLRSIEGVKIAVLFRETPRGSFRVSLRSSYGINIARVAKLFGGGGHHNSAGCSIRNSEKEKMKLLGELRALAE